MDDFKLTTSISLQPGDSAVPYTFVFSVCTGVDANDGSLPYGTTLSSCVVTAKLASTGVDATSSLIASQAVGTNRVNLTLKYPGTVGKYTLEFACTLSTGAVLCFNFKRVNALSE